MNNILFFTSQNLFKVMNLTLELHVTGLFS